MATIRDDDLLYIQRGDVPYKWTGLELKELSSSTASDGSLIVGAYLTPNGQSYDGTSDLTINVDGTVAATADKVVIRDSTGGITGTTINGTSFNVTNAFVSGKLEVGGTTGNANITLDGSNGSAAFSGDVKRNTYDSPGGNNGWRLGAYTLTINNDTNNSWFFTGYKGSTETLRLFNDGSAEFATGNFEINSSGQAYAKGFFADSPNSNSSLTFRSKDTSGNTSFSVLANGDGVFKGSVAISGQNVAHGPASTLKISQNTTTHTQLRSYGPNTTTRGNIQFKVTSSDGSSDYQPLILEASGRAVFGEAVDSSYTTGFISDANATGGPYNQFYTNNSATNNVISIYNGNSGSTPFYVTPGGNISNSGTIVSSGSITTSSDIFGYNGYFSAGVNAATSFQLTRAGGNQVTLGGSDTYALWTKDSKVTINYGGDASFVGTLSLPGSGLATAFNIGNGNTQLYYNGGGYFGGGVVFGGGGTVKPNASMDFESGNWTGDKCKIQNHSDYLYIQAPTNGHLFRSLDGFTRLQINNSGNTIPGADSTYTLGDPGYRWATVYADLFVGSINGNASTASYADNSGLLNGYPASFATAANTVPVRDGSGDISTRYFIGQWIQMRVNSDTYTSTAQGMVCWGDDGWYRQFTKADSRTLLDVPSRSGSGASGTWGINISGNSATCTVNSSDSNASYYMVWRSGNNLYYTGGIYCNPYYDTMYATNFNSMSDIRVKKNIQPLEGALDKLKQIRGVEYDRIDQSEQHQLGVIAQEVEEVFPEVVDEDDKGMKSVSYQQLIPVLIEAIKEQQEQIEELKKLCQK